MKTYNNENTESYFTELRHPITMRSRQDYYDARYWECDSYTVPYGGTHAKSTHDLSSLKLQWKNIGKDKERLIFSL